MRDDERLNMERRVGFRQWFADVGYIYLLVAVLVTIVLVLSDAPPLTGLNVASGTPPAQTGPGPALGR